MWENQLAESGISSEESVGRLDVESWFSHI
jgi:hypothetical protein